MVIKRTIHRKALLAILFAGGILNSQMPVSASDTTEPSESIMQGIESDSNIEPELRAFYLLRLASDYQTIPDRNSTDERYKGVAGRATRLRRFNETLEAWAIQVSTQSKSDAGHAETKQNSNSNLVNSVTEAAVAQLQKSNNKFATIMLYYIASQLFKRADNLVGAKKCRQFLDDSFKACAKDTPVDEQKMRGAASVLDAMAFGLIPLQIVDREGTQSLTPWSETRLASISENEFKRAEQLRLKSVSILDRLPATNHMRRKAHRDMVFQYAVLGKAEMSEKEKQTLFGLVGSKNEIILYPTSGSCGSLVWWNEKEWNEKDKSAPKVVFDCGLG